MQDRTSTESLPKAKFKITFEIEDPGEFVPPPLDTPEAIVRDLLFSVEPEFFSEMMDSMLSNYVTPEISHDFLARTVLNIAALRKSLYRMQAWKVKITHA